MGRERRHDQKHSLDNQTRVAGCPKPQTSGTYFAMDGDGKTFISSTRALCFFWSMSRSVWHCRYSMGRDCERSKRHSSVARLPDNGNCRCRLDRPHSRNWLLDRGITPYVRTRDSARKKNISSQPVPRVNLRNEPAEQLGRESWGLQSIVIVF